MSLHPQNYPGYTPEDGHTPRDRHTPSDGNTPREKITAVKGWTSTESPETTVDHVNTQRRVYPNRRVWGPERSTPAQNAPSYYSPIGLVTRSGLNSSVPLETCTASNRQLVATLAKQNLPKCHPDVYKGDVAHGKDRLRRWWEMLTLFPNRNSTSWEASRKTTLKN